MRYRGSNILIFFGLEILGGLTNRPDFAPSHPSPPACSFDAFVVICDKTRHKSINLLV